VQNGDGVPSIYIANTTEFSSLKHASSLTTVSAEPHPIPLQINKFLHIVEKNDDARTY